MQQQMTDQQLEAYKKISERLRAIDKQINALENLPDTRTTRKNLAIWRQLHADNLYWMREICGESYLLQ